MALLFLLFCDGFLYLLPPNKSFKIIAGKPKTFAVVVANSVTRTVSEIFKHHGLLNAVNKMTHINHPEMTIIIQITNKCRCFVSWANLSFSCSSNPFLSGSPKSRLLGR